MVPRKKKGATLALVISLMFVFLFIGAAFFVWQLLIGGGKELQHATDSGNLNVAKQSLKTPSYVIPAGPDPTTGTDLRAEFKDVVDPGFKVNLLNFNRLVGKAILAQLNAKSEGTAAAKENARQLTDAVYKIGQQLQSQLASSSSLKSQFEDVSNKNSVRMLQHPDTAGQAGVSHTDAEYALSYVARGKASNLYIDRAELPPGAQFSNSDIVKKDVGGDKEFLVGYSELSTSKNLSGMPQTWTVPLRPGEQPHLIGVDDFANGTEPPFNPYTLPNAFKSGGETNFIRASADVKLRSCAVVGVLDKTFPLLSSGGTIIVDNAGAYIDSDTINDSGSSIYADKDKMMEPAGVEIFKVRANNGTFSDGKQEHEFMLHSSGNQYPSLSITPQSTQTAGIESSPTLGNPENEVKTYPGNDSPSSEDYWAMKMRDQPRYVSQWPDRRRIMGVDGRTDYGATVGGPTSSFVHVAYCNNLSFSGGGGAANPSECGNTPVFAAYFRGDIGVPSGGTGSTTYTDLMPLEQYILKIQGGFGAGAGCVFVPAMGPIGGCANGTVGSPMKHITGSPPFPIGTLQDLMNDTGAGAVKSDMLARIRQIVPNSDADSIFSKPIPFNSIMYIYNKEGSLVMDTNKPSSLQYDYNRNQPNRPVITPPMNIPDGTRQDSSHPIQVSGTWVSGSMWECGSGRADGRSNSVASWYPSSGKGGLLGILRFQNCTEASGPDWCCP